jgi:uncharacterized membrane protein YfcA
MDSLLSYLPDVAFLLVAGTVAGFIAGLFGVGGGTVTVPVLFYWFLHMKVPADIAMHTAVATSLATIIPTSLASARAHNLKGSLDRDLLKTWMPYIAVGSVFGVTLAAFLSGYALRGVFGGFLILVALYMLLGREGVVLRAHLPSLRSQKLFAVFAGGISSVVGVGGGAVSVPYMTLYGIPMQRAIGTASAIGMIIAIPGTLGFILSGWGQVALPPFSLGYVNMLGFMVMLPATILMAPVGAKLAHKLSRQLLRRTFGAFILFVAAKMLWGLLSP